MNIKRILFGIVVTIMLSGFVFPILWVYITSIKSSSDILSTAWFFEPTLDNYRFIFFSRESGKSLLNSFFISVVSTFIVMLISIPASYSFSRFNTSGGQLLFTTISTRMFPAVVAAMPFFMAMKNLRLLDTHLSLIMMYVYFNTSFATFLMYGFFNEIPEEVEYAAMVDGYGRISILRKIVLPMVKPGIAITAIFTLIWSWNEFFFAFLFTRRTARTVSVDMSLFWGATQIQWGPMAALMSVAMLPTLLAAIFLQRYIIRGLTFGAVKG